MADFDFKTWWRAAKSVLTNPLGVTGAIIVLLTTLGVAVEMFGGADTLASLWKLANSSAPALAIMCALIVAIGFILATQLVVKETAALETKSRDHAETLLAPVRSSLAITSELLLTQNTIALLDEAKRTFISGQERCKRLAMGELPPRETSTRDSEMHLACDDLIRNIGGYDVLLRNLTKTHGLAVDVTDYRDQPAPNEENLGERARLAWRKAWGLYQQAITIGESLMPTLLTRSAALRNALANLAIPSEPSGDANVKITAG